MTLGEKIRCARKCIGISQGQLADKLCVSRSAVAKWETDKGLPDVENLKLLSRLLCVSVDKLLDDAQEDDPVLIRERCFPETYGPGCSKMQKDRLVRNKFPDARITVLLGRPELNQQGAVMDEVRGFLCRTPYGDAEYVRSVNRMGRSFYLVEQEEDQLFVSVSDHYLEITPLIPKRTDSRFSVGSWTFIRREELPDRERDE